MNHCDRVRLTIEKDGLAVLTLTRPEAGNAIDLASARALRRAASELASRTDVTALLLTGQGRRFCVGGDLRAMAEATDGPAWVREVADTTHAAVISLYDLEVPVVAAVHGAAAGAGLSLCLVADLVFVTPDVTLAAAWGVGGLTPDAGATWLLPRAVGTHRASRMLLADHRLDGREAMAWGLAHEVVGECRLLERATEIAQSLARGPAAALGRTRALAHSGWDSDLRHHLDAERDAIAQARGTAQPYIETFLHR